MTDMASDLLLVHPFDAYAGSQRVSRDLVSLLRKAGIRVVVKLGFGGRGFLSELPAALPDIRLDRVSIRKILYPLWVCWVMLPIAWAAMRGHVIWAATVYAVPPILLAVLLFPGRTVIHLHEASFPAVFHLLLRFAAWRGATLLCVSSDHAKRLGVVTQVHPNPVSISTCQSASQRNRLLFVGSTHPIKGFDLYIAICERLTGTPFRKAAYLSSSSTHDEMLIKSARAAGVDIVFGEQSIETIYADGFLMLMCTDPQLVSETFSLVAAEAMAALVPVGGAGAEVLPEVVGEALAFNYASRDPDQIARAITDLWADSARWNFLRTACEARRTLFSEAAFVERTLAILKTRN